MKSFSTVEAAKIPTQVTTVGGGVVCYFNVP